jgi:anti-sigma B factor antagonist
MNIEQTLQANGVLVLQCQSENLDASNVREFKELMRPMVEKHPKIVFDMSGMKFVDSSGLGALIACLRETNARQGDLRLCQLSNSVNALFVLMRMHRVFNIHDSKDLAIASFA